ncbi:MAG: putative membrane protein [Anaerolineaceae bacterium 46_22]|nr:MAG: putative membrane protein [Anaerolineaceae bacterium 46_22]
MSLINNNRERIRFIKFSIVGMTGTIVDFGVMNILRLALNTPLIWAQGISFVCAVINNFLWNRYWTYPESRSKAAPKQLLQFLVINIIGILIRSPLVPWLDKNIINFLDGMSLSLPLKNMVISQNLALAISIIIVSFWNFFANRYWTYGNVPESEIIKSDHSKQGSIQETD